MDLSIDDLLLGKVDFIILRLNYAVHACLFKWQFEPNLDFSIGQGVVVGRITVCLEGVFLYEIIALKLLHDAWEHEHTVAEFFDVLVELLVSFADSLVETQVFFFFFVEQIF